jgi:hypothetical protein
MGFLAYLCAGLLGGALGLSELLSRFRDRPSALLKAVAAWLYVGFNALASLGALLLVDLMGWQFSLGDTTASTTTRVLVAGLGAAALFRSNFFVAKIGDENVGIGPSTLLMNYLASAERSIDRGQMQARLKDAGETMKDFDFKLHNELTTACIAAAASLTPDAILSLKNSVEALADSEASEAGKSLVLGLLIVDAVGADVLKQAVTSLI